MKLETVDVPDPGPGEVLLHQSACGLNYIDIYQRSGVYPLDLPSGLGMAAAGVVEAVGDGVEDLGVGDRVAYPMALGGYASARVLPAWKTARIPDGIDDETAAASMLQGLTAHYLLHRTYRPSAGDPVLVYAAAGGVGQLLCQWARHLGAEVIGCVGSDEKAEIARQAGAHHTINYQTESISGRARELTDGVGVAVAYDSIGKATVMDSIDSLRPFGMFVTYGNASGKVEPFDLNLLAPKGSLFVTRPTLATHTSTPELLREGAETYFRAITDGVLTVHVNQRYQLADIASAHTDLAARRTTGSTAIIP